MSETFTFERGETIRLCLDVTAGEKSDITGITAHLRRIQPTRKEVLKDEPIAASFEIVGVVDQASGMQGWYLTIPSALSASLSPGTYQADAKVKVGGDDRVTAPVIIKISEPATQ